MPTILNVSPGAFVGLFDIVGKRVLKGSFIEPVELYRSVRVEESSKPIVIEPIGLIKPFKVTVIKELKPVVAIWLGDLGD